MIQMQNKISIKLEGSVITTNLNQVKNVSSIYVRNALGLSCENLMFNMDQQSQIIKDVCVAFEDHIDAHTVTLLVRKLIQLNDVSNSAIVLVSNSFDLKLSNQRVNELENIFKKHLK